MSKMKFLGCVTFLVSLVMMASPSHNTSRFFSFLEKPEEYVTKGKSHISPSLFITSASTAYGRGGGNTGIPELWGKYDLKDVIEAVKAVKIAQGASSYNPFQNEVGYSDWNEKEVKYNIDGKVKSRGIILSAEQALFKTNFSIGCFLPIMHVDTSLRFAFDSENSHVDVKNATYQEVEMLDRIRRSVHKDLGLKGADWVKTGVGDLDLHLRWRHLWDHTLKTRSIDFNLQTGFLIPTGQMSDKDYPSSVPFMGNGHWAWYGDLVSEFELKQNWKFGLMAGLTNQFKKRHTTRLAYYKEPSIFSPLSGDVEIDPGLTLKFSPYFTLENLMDGLHFQLRYGFVRHNTDTWKDMRRDKTVLSYLEANDREHIANIRAHKKDLFKWTSHYLTMQLMYDSLEAMKNWSLKPKFYAVYDYPLGGSGVCKTHQFTIGVELHLW